MEYHQITLGEYLQYKQEIKERLASIAENFVYVGYRLKQIRDNKLYLQDGYEDINEFAQKEYGITKSTVSRFIAINNKYSVEGNSPELQTKYIGFGSSKLVEMLTLPDEIAEEVTTETTISQIREVKKEIAQEVVEKTVESESCDVATNLENTECESIFTVVLKDIFRNEKEVYKDLFRYLESGEKEEEEILDIINPSHFKMVLISKGKVLMGDVAINIMIPGKEKIKINYQEFANHFIELFGVGSSTEQEAYRKIFERELEEEPLVEVVEETAEEVEEETAEEPTKEPAKKEQQEEKAEEQKEEVGKEETIIETVEKPTQSEEVKEEVIKAEVITEIKENQALQAAEKILEKIKLGKTEEALYSCLVLERQLKEILGIEEHLA